MLDVFVTEVGLQRPRVVSPVGQGIAAGMSQHVRVDLEPKLRASIPARSTIRAKPAVVKGAPRSEVNTKGDLGSCSRWIRRSALSSSPTDGWRDQLEVPFSHVFGPPRLSRYPKYKLENAGHVFKMVFNMNVNGKAAPPPRQHGMMRRRRGL
jgi:hypothetical protein